MQPAGGVAVDEQAVVAVLLPDDPDRLVEFVVVLGEVAAEVRRLVRLQAAAVLAQVQGVEVDAPRHEEVGQVGLEEVVDEAVDVEHGGAGRALGPAGDERGDDRALVVVPEVDGAARVRRAENVGDGFHAGDRTAFRYAVVPPRVWPAQTGSLADRRG